MVKKIFLSLLVLTALRPDARAADLSLGVKAGVNFSGYTNFGLLMPDMSSNGLQAGYYAGVVVHPQAGRFLSYKVEILYSRENIEAGMFDKKYDLRTDIISVPVMASIKPIARLRFDLGLVCNILASSNGDEFGGTELYDFGTEGPKSFELSLGAGVQYRLVGGLHIDCRYTHGISNAYNYHGISGRKRNLMAGVTFMF